MTANTLYGASCPPVVCQRTGPAFRWHDGKEWHQGEALPAEIARALPGPEWARCEVHAWRRLGDRSAA